ATGLFAGHRLDHALSMLVDEMAVRLYPLCAARRVTAPQAPLTTAAALPIHSSTGTVSIVVSLHDPSDCSLGLIRRLTCYRAAKLSTRFPQKTGLLRRFLCSHHETRANTA